LNRGWRFCRAIPGGLFAIDTAGVLAANGTC
jgi:hypothetical protein